MKVSIKRENGFLKVDINGKLYDPLAFKSFRPNEKNVTEFYSAGVRLFSVLSSGIINALGVPYSLYGESWVGEKEYDFSAIDRQMDMFISCAPDGYFAPMLQVDTRPWFLHKHKNAPNSFTNLSWAAHCKEWKKAAARYLRAAIRHCEEKYGDRIYGYFILGGMTTEWLAHPDHEGAHPLKEAAFKRWMKNKKAVLPGREQLDSTGRVFLDESEQLVFEARRFHAQTVSDVLLYFAAEAQGVIRHKKLLGCYYGYLMHLGGEFLYDSGHLGYERVFYSDDIDMISSPSDYNYRRLSDPSAFMLTQSTLDRLNKLYFLEFDHITHVAPTMINEPSPDDSGNSCLKEIPGANNKCKDETESLNLMWRDFILCYARGAALWWFDMFDGWFRSEKMMRAIQKMVALNGRLKGKSRQSVAEIAVFAEGEAMYHVRKTSGIATYSLIDMHGSLSGLGAPYDLYTFGDIGSVRDGYKLIVLLNQYEISAAGKKAIDKLKSSGAAVLYMYAPDYAGKDGNSVDRISAAVGMRIRESKDGHGGLVVDGRVYENKVEAPYFDVVDDSAIPLARAEDGAVIVAKAKNARDYYAAVPYIPSVVLKRIAKDSGVFIYSDEEKVYTYANEAAIGVYNATDTDAEICVNADGTYVDMIEDGEYESRNGTLILPKKMLNAFLLVRKED